MLLLSLSLSSNIHSARAQGATAASSKNIPVIDYEALGGSLGIVGSFAGVDLYDSTGRSSYVASISSSTSSTSRSHLLWLDQEGTPSILASVQGSINAVVQCSNEAVYFGGSFSSILSSNTPASNMAVYFPANDSITALSSGVDGPVSALACDDTTSTLYVGGSFRAPVGASESAGYDGAVAAWDIKTSTWSPLGFGGFRGNNVEVLSIALNDASSASDRSLLFGGSFQTYWLNESTTTSTSTSVSVTTLANGTLSIKESNTTSSPSSDGNSVTVFPSLGASLIPISLASAEITSSSSTSNTRYSDASNVFCPAGDDGDNDSTWLARDGDQSSRITARLFAPLDVGGFRIGNTRVNGAGTQSFR